MLLPGVLLIPLVSVWESKNWCFLLIQGDVYLFTNFEDAVQNAELIIECVEEDLSAKMTLFESKTHAAMRENVKLLKILMTSRNF